MVGTKTPRNFIMTHRILITPLANQDIDAHVNYHGARDIRFVLENDSSLD